ncbi:MAG: AIR carboxylase family protein [Planctomycetaceae bacterium]
MKPASEILEEFGIPHECRVVSAHRLNGWPSMPSRQNHEGLEVIIAGCRERLTCPEWLHPKQFCQYWGCLSKQGTQWADSLLSIVQMPGGVPVGTLAIGEAGAKNGGLLAVRILANTRPDLREKLHHYHQQQIETVLKNSELK